MTEAQLNQLLLALERVETQLKTISAKLDAPVYHITVGEPRISNDVAALKRFTDAMRTALKVQNPYSRDFSENPE